MKKKYAIFLCGILLSYIICWILTPIKALASVSAISQNDVNFKMEYPRVHLENNNLDAEKSINNDIEIYVDKFKQDYYNGEFIDGSFSFETKYEDDKVISLMLIDY